MTDAEHDPGAPFRNADGFLQVVCPKCGKTVGARDRDGTPKMHRERPRGRRWAVIPWCDGGVPR